MNISKTILSGVILAITSAGAFAAEMNAGTIHFTGQIIEPSCTIDGDSGTDSTVPLGTYPTSLFRTPGTESTYMPFTIQLIDCPVSSTGLPSVQLTFSGTSALTQSSTLLDVGTSVQGGTAAAGIGIAISPENKDTQLIQMDGSEGQVYIPLPTKAGDAISANFNARYKSFETTVTAGPADADLTVNILYR